MAWSRRSGSREYLICQNAPRSTSSATGYNVLKAECTVRLMCPVHRQAVLGRKPDTKDCTGSPLSSDLEVGISVGMKERDYARDCVCTQANAPHITLAGGKDSGSYRPARAGLIGRRHPHYVPPHAADA